MLYSILYYLDEVSVSVRKDLITHLNTGFRFLLKAMEKKNILSEDCNIDHRRSL